MFGKNHQYETSIILQRALILALIMIFVLIIIITRVFYLQILSYDEFYRKAEKNRIIDKPIIPQRGLIFDRNGILLAGNIDKPSLMMTVSKNTLQDVQQLVELNKLISINLSSLDNKKPNQVVLLKYLTKEEVIIFQLYKDKFPKFFIKDNLERIYPYKDITAHIIGYMGNSDDVEVDRDFYENIPFIGKTGVEYFYEQKLRGSLGKRSTETTVSGEEISQLALIDAINGDDLTITIDINLQKKIYEMIQQYIGTVVVVEVATGDILAAVSSPSFDPNSFSPSSEKKQLLSLYKDNNPLFNRFVSGRYPPASTIKPFIAMTILNSTLNKNLKIFDKGYFISETDQKIFRNWQKKGAGYIDLRRALVKSNNTYFYTIADQLGIDYIYPELRHFGFGENITLDIPTQNVGILPNPAWKMAQFGEKWLPGDTINLSIGQGYFLVNPLQLAYATNIIANKGKKKKLHINKNIMDNNLNFLSNQYKDFDFLTKAMVDVLHSKDGTAYKTQVKTLTNSSFKVAGKTGTAQVVNAIRDEFGRIKVKPIKNDNSVFIAFAPANAPKVSIVVILENAGSGSLAATPLGLKILEFYLNNIY